MKYIIDKILIVLGIIIGIVVMGFFIRFINKPKPIKPKNNITVKVGQKVPSIKKYLNEKDYKKVKGTTVSWKDILIEDDCIFYTGKYLGQIKYNDKTYNIHLTVIDKQAPTIENVKDIEVYVGDKVDLFKNVKITDNSHDEIEKDIKGDYDLNKKGTYNLFYVVKDKSGNITEKEFKLIVKEKIIEEDPTVIKNSVPSKTNKGYNVENKNGAYYINGILVANKSYSLSSTYNPGGLSSSFNSAFNEMNAAAKADGINLRIISGFRSYNTQKTLYNNYVNRDGKAAADRYSARAGHSEHQTGLAADINSLEQSWENTKEGKWLNDNCYKYGFIIRYPKGKESITGYMFEPWHIRYVGKDIAKSIYNNGNWSTLEEYLGIDSKY